MCPTSARCGSLAFGVSFCGLGILGAAAAAGEVTGCAGWVGFMLMGLLSSGRGFHISAPFLSVYLYAQREPIFMSGTPVADHSGIRGLVYCCISKSNSYCRCAPERQSHAHTRHFAAQLYVFTIK